MLTGEPNKYYISGVPINFIHLDKTDSLAIGA